MPPMRLAKLPVAARVLLAAAVAVLVFWLGTSAHLRMACIQMDTPYLPLCPAAPEGPQLERQLGQRIARNPGDSDAWVQLMLAQGTRPSAGVLQATAALAPSDPNVMTRRAGAALQRGDLALATTLLVDNVRYRGSGPSAVALAQLLAAPGGLQLLRPHLASAADWLPGVLGAIPAAKVPLPSALTLVMEARDRGALPDASWRNYLRNLKTSGYWVDAYGLWLASRKDPAPLLYNGSFDDPFEQDGFDWEFTLAPRSRAGVVFEQDAVARRGNVLGMEFTGRSFPSPIVRQYVFTAPGSYRLQGEYMATKFRSEQGLVWSVVCTAGRKAVAGRSEPLQDTGGVWRKVEVQFTIPPDCGPVASVQLEPAAAYEATTGLRGELALDAFSLIHALQ